MLMYYNHMFYCCCGENTLSSQTKALMMLNKDIQGTV